MKQKQRLAIGLLLAAGLGATDMTNGGDNGNVLLDNCEIVSRGLPTPEDRAEAFQSGFCFGLIEGVADTLALAQLLTGTPLYCPPKGLAPLKRIHGVVRYLRARGEELSSKPRSVWAAMALRELYPCEN